jgi:hypothetical protein
MSCTHGFALSAPLVAAIAASLTPRRMHSDAYDELGPLAGSSMDGNAASREYDGLDPWQASCGRPRSNSGSPELTSERPQRIHLTSGARKRPIITQA